MFLQQGDRFGANGCFALEHPFGVGGAPERRAALRLFRYAADGELGICAVHSAEHFGIHFRQNGVIRIDKGDVIPGSGPYSRVARCRNAGVFLLDQTYAGFFFGIVSADFPGTVGGTVVDEDQLDIRPVLAQQGIDGVRKDTCAL